MKIGSGEYRYEWIDHWAVIPDTPSGRENGRTHGVVVTRSGDVIVFHQASPAVLRFDRCGRLIDSWGDSFPGAHGLTRVEEDGEEYLWLTDEKTAAVVKTTLDGEPVMSLDRPRHPAYESGGAYSPTWVAVDEARHGGAGDIWVADGYGSSLVHRYDRNGLYLDSLSGEEGPGGRFNCPHGISFIHRDGESELCIADRGNKQIQVYDRRGEFLRVVGKGALNSPCVCLPYREAILLPELVAHLTIMDNDGGSACYLGENPHARDTDGWPNLSKDQLREGRFNSPHSAAADADGNLYVVEWIVGGRITKLALCP
jgi:hypothetical protein